MKRKRREGGETLEEKEGRPLKRKRREGGIGGGGGAARTSG